jgi:hypothetical protein
MTDRNVRPTIQTETVGGPALPYLLLGRGKQRPYVGAGRDARATDGLVSEQHTALIFVACSNKVGM